MLNQFGDLVFRNSISAFEIVLTKLSNVWAHGITSYSWVKLIDSLANQANTDWGAMADQTCVTQSWPLSCEALHQICCISLIIL